MDHKGTGFLDRKGVLLTLFVIQTICAVVFAADVALDLAEVVSGAYGLGDFVPEALASVGLAVALVIQFRLLRQMQHRQAKMQQGLDVARGALSDLMERHFRDWQLTRAEQDIATFTIKGYSIAETAALRGSAEGTVKTHLNAIYRKAGVAGRAQLVSVLVEDLLRGPLPVEGGSGDRQASA